jgi:hypothetical protein
MPSREHKDRPDNPYYTMAREDGKTQPLEDNYSEESRP